LPRKPAPAVKMPVKSLPEHHGLSHRPAAQRNIENTFHNESPFAKPYAAKGDFRIDIRL